MPKFSIYEGFETPGQPNRIRCDIGWARGRDVQLGVTRLADGLEPVVGDETSYDDAPTSTTIVVSGGTAPQTITTAGSARAIAAGPLEDGPTWRGYHMHLTRTQINTLIRTLREARDAAYGRDE